MSQEILLGVVDQSVLRKGAKASEALVETVRLAQAVEQFGYARYWVAEHHNSTSFTGNAPEILIGQIAASTTSIQVGSGGVMLPHYSALKVAEQFRMLDALYPGRIELGIGRAPGSDRLTAAALAFPRSPIDINLFPQMVTHLLGFLHGRLESGHPFAEIRVSGGCAARVRAGCVGAGFQRFQRSTCGPAGPPILVCGLLRETPEAMDPWSPICTANSSNRRSTFRSRE